MERGREGILHLSRFCSDLPESFETTGHYWVLITLKMNMF